LVGVPAEEEDAQAALAMASNNQAQQATQAITLLKKKGTVFSCSTGQRALETIRFDP